MNDDQLRLRDDDKHRCVRLVLACTDSKYEVDGGARFIHVYIYIYMLRCVGFVC